MASLVMDLLAGLSDRMVLTIAISVAHTVPVVFCQAVMIFIEHNNLCTEYLTQKNKEPEIDLVKRCYLNSFINHFIVSPFGMWLTAPYLMNFIPVSAALLPSLSTLLVDVLCCVIVEDMLFYWGHRWLHSPFLYKHVHKRHHEFRVLKGMSIASEFTHPLESLLGNIFPVIAGPMLLRCHVCTVAVWVVLRMLKTCDAHSGYNFPASPFNVGFPFNEAKRHDFHHSANIGSYGSFFVVWDRLCGTDAAYKNRQRKHNKVL